MDLERAVDTLREARLAAGLTLRAAAERAGTSHATLAAYEAGRKSPTLTTLARLLRAYGLAADIELSPRIRERNELERGKELEEVLRLAERDGAALRRSRGCGHSTDGRVLCRSRWRSRCRHSRLPRVENRV